MGDTEIREGGLAFDSRQMEERALTMRVLRHQNVGDSEEPVMLAQDLISAGRLRDARLVCMTALHKDPTDVDLLLTGAGIAETLGEHVDARTLLVKAARLAPEWAEPMVRLARLLFHMEDYGRAWAAVERCYSMDPADAATCALRADIEQAHRLTLRKDRFLQDEHADDAAMLANALVAESRFDDALAVLNYALERDGEDADALFVKGTILKARGERELAEIALRRVTQMECGWVEAWETMADLLEEKGSVAHADRLRAHAATIEVDPLMLVDMAVIAGAHEAAFDELTMSEELDRAVAAGVSAMSDLKRSIVSARAPLPAAPAEAVDLQGSTNPSMLIRNVDAMFAQDVAPESTPEASSEAEFAPVVVPQATLKPLQPIMVDDVSDANPMLHSGGKTLPLGTYKPTMPRPEALANDEKQAKTLKTASGGLKAPGPDSSAPGPRQNAKDAQEDTSPKSLTATMPLTPMKAASPKSLTATMPLTPMVVEKVDAAPAALPPSPLAPSQPLRNPVSVRRIIDVRGRQRDQVCVIRDGEAQPLASLIAETEADLDALLSDDTLFPEDTSEEAASQDAAVEAASEVAAVEAASEDAAVEAASEAADAVEAADAGSDEDLFPIDPEAAAFASIDIELDFPIDAEAAAFPSIDIDVTPLSVAPPAPETSNETPDDASVRFAMFEYLSGPEFRRLGAGATHHAGVLTTTAFDAPSCALRVRDGVVTLETPALEASSETQEALAELMDAQVSFELSTESQAVFEELLALQTTATNIVEASAEVVEAEAADADTFDALQSTDDADTVFDGPVARVAKPTPELMLQTAEPGTPAATVDDDVAIPLAVRKNPPQNDGLDLRAQILAAAGVDADALETALQATRLPVESKKAEAELDSFIDEVVVKRPRLRMRSTTKGAPYRPPSPRDLFPKHVREDEAGGELTL
ncbi:MAG: tetratricopeptide repeat protein [Polyangiales bacterium]